jgi:hypothetical protein
MIDDKIIYDTHFRIGMPTGWNKEPTGRHNENDNQNLRRSGVDPPLQVSAHKATNSLQHQNQAMLSR